MAWKIRDFAKLDNNLIDEAWTVFKNSHSSEKEKKKLRLDTIATHSGKLINRRVYPGIHVKDATKTFFKGNGANFDKPFLKNHNSELDPIGRVVEAVFKQTATSKKFSVDHLNPSEEGSGHTIITSHILDQDAIEKFLDGRFSTVSVGGSTDDAFCSQCTKDTGKLQKLFGVIKNANSDKEPTVCDHFPGQTYSNGECYVITGKLTYHEVSQVAVPADNAAINIAMHDISLSDTADGSKSLYEYIDRKEEMYVDTAPTRFSILDASGNIINGLDTDTYKSTKTISVPKTITIKDVNNSDTNDNNNLDKSENSILSDEVFANARILKHFSNLGMIVLNDTQKEEVAKLDTAELTDIQSKLLGDLFITHPSIPFKLHDKAHLDIMLQLLSSDQLSVNKELYKEAVHSQAKLEHLYNKDNIMENEALVKALKDAQSKIDELSSVVKDQVEKIGKLEAQSIKDDNSIKDLSVKLHTDRVSKIIELRTELGCHDTLTLSDESKKEETLKALNDKYIALDSNVIEVLLEDMLAQKQAGGFVNSVIEKNENTNPLVDEDNSSDKDKFIKDDNKTINDKSADKKLINNAW